MSRLDPVGLLISTLVVAEVRVTSCAMLHTGRTGVVVPRGRFRESFVAFSGFSLIRRGLGSSGGGLPEVRIVRASLRIFALTMTEQRVSIGGRRGLPLYRLVHLWLTCVLIALRVVVEEIGMLRIEVGVRLRLTEYRVARTSLRVAGLTTAES